MNSLVISKRKVRALMEINNIKTQTELAKKMGITKNQLSNILSGDFSPLKSNINKLCNILNVSIGDIIDGKSFHQIDFFRAYENIQEYTYKKECKEFIDTLNIRPKKKYNVVELFAGGGGLALGLEEAGFNTLGLVEINKYCCNTLRNNRENWNVIEGSIVDIAEIGIKKYINQNNEIDLLSGGYPCQAFSYAGKKLGLDDVRGTMFYYYADVLKQLMPKVFLAENVKGLISHDSGKTLQTMIDVFEEIGYVVDYDVLKATDYDVAQKRNRIVIIGIRKDLVDKYNVKFLYPKPLNTNPILRDALMDVPKSVGAKYPEKKKAVLSLVPPGGYWKDLPEEIAKEYMGKSFYSGGGRTGMARRISWDEPCLTLTCSPAQKQTERCHPDEIRPFTIREYARIQSFPDSWNFDGPMGEQYKQIGNAVPVKLAKHVGLAIIDILNKMD